MVAVLGHALAPSGHATAPAPLTVATPRKKCGREPPHRGSCSRSTVTHVSWASGCALSRPTTLLVSPAVPGTAATTQASALERLVLREQGSSWAVQHINEWAARTHALLPAAGPPPLCCCCRAKAGGGAPPTRVVQAVWFKDGAAACLLQLHAVTILRGTIMMQRENMRTRRCIQHMLCKHAQCTQPRTLSCCWLHGNTPCDVQLAAHAAA
jgi:hypothetical protein